jgi:hypothetical protein
MGGLNARIAHGIAHSLDKQMERRELRALCDERTEWGLTSWELDRLTQWVEEHPAYEALPELPETGPDSPELEA